MTLRETPLEFDELFIIKTFRFSISTVFKIKQALKDYPYVHIFVNFRETSRLCLFVILEYNRKNHKKI